MDIGNQQGVTVVAPLEAPVEGEETNPKPSTEPQQPVVAAKTSVPAPARPVARDVLAG